MLKLQRDYCIQQLEIIVLFLNVGIACFISGGGVGSWTASVLVYDADDLYGAPIETSMINARTHHACTIFQSQLHNRRPVAIVAGGYPKWVQKKAEIWDFTQEGTSWVASKIISTLICITNSRIDNEVF